MPKNEALAALGGVVSASTLATAQLEVAIQNQAEEFAKGAAEPIIDGLRRALELFPAMVEREVTSRTTVRGVFTPGNIEGGGGRFKGHPPRRGTRRGVLALAAVLVTAW